MKWYKFWAKGKEDKPEKQKSKNLELLDMDFYCQLTYMAAIATSGISRSGLFEHAARLPYVSASYFKRVTFVAKAFNHDYAEACNIVGQLTKEPEVKALLLRLSGALASGEDIAVFLERESQVFSESYGDRYERGLDILGKWTDAYIALIMTAAIVTVMAVVTLMIGNVSPAFLLTLMMATIVVTITGSWLIYRAAPKERKNHTLPHRSKEQNLARALVKITLPPAGVIVIVLLALKADIGWSLIVIGIFLVPLGIVSWIDDRKIYKRDTEIAGLLRSLGGVSQAIGATVKEAMGRLDFRSMGTLKDEINLLYTRLLAGMDPILCWDRFVGETGSEQVTRSVRIFRDGVMLGGEPERVGNDASNFAVKIALLREKRGLIANGILWLSMVMHAVVTLLVIFVYRTLFSFSTLIQSISADVDDPGAMSDMPSFGIYSGTSDELSMLYVMIIIIVIVLALANAFAVYSTDGGHIYKLSAYLAMTLLISGATIIFIPPVVDIMFSGIAA